MRSFLARFSGPMPVKTVERQLRRNSQQIAHTQAELGVLEEQLELSLIHI